MADLYGAKSLPITAEPAAPTTVVVRDADPLLSYLASYLKTVANVRLGAEWLLLAPGTTNPVREALEHDPEQFEFNDKVLPALFLYRTGGTGFENRATDWRIATETIALLWVLPGATQDKLAQRSRFPSKLFDLFDAAVEANRDRAWIVDGDADPKAATMGSDLTAFARFHTLKMGRWQRKPLVIRSNEQGAAPMAYPAYELTATVEERLVRDPAVNPALTGIDLTLRTADAGYGDGGLVLAELELDRPDP